MTNPATFGRYQIVERLGSGSFGIVYRASDPLLQRDVALKVLSDLCSDPEDQRRFLTEAQALARLSHSNIVTVFDVGETGGRPFIAMELVSGVTLAEMLRKSQGAPLSLTAVHRIISDLASALDHVHSAGLVHRDIKPSNVMITPAGRLVLMDFGVALAAGRTRLTQADYGMGTAEYAPPEQISGVSVGPAADIYALGILTYELLCGHPPFTGDILHVLDAQKNSPPPPIAQSRPDLPDHAARAVTAALAKDPMARPQTAGVFASALLGAATSTIGTVGSQPTTAKPGPPAPTPQPYVRGQVTAPATLVVAPDGSGTHRQLYHAVQSAPPGATIEIRPGRYEFDMSLVISKSVTLAGNHDPYNKPELCNLSTELFVIRNGGVHISGLVLKSGDNVALNEG